MSSRSTSLLLLFLFCLVIPSLVLAEQESSLDAIREGHWLEIRGKRLDDGSFRAKRVEIIHGQRYEELIGRVSAQKDENSFTLLGQNVEMSEKTSSERINRADLVNKRVKVEGHYRGPKRFSSREIVPWGEGRDRLVGRADLVRKDEEGLLVSIMNYIVRIPGELLVRHEDPLDSYMLSETRTMPVAPETRNEDDLFGEGIRVSENLLVAGIAQARWVGENEYDLNARKPRDREDAEASFRARLIYRPVPGFVGVFELSHRRLWRDDDKDGHLHVKNTVIGESFAYWIDPFKWNVDLQLGRIDFDEEREWLYDQNLDGARVFYFGSRLTVDFSVSTTLSDGKIRDENTVNTMLYVSNDSARRHIAFYIIHRATDLVVQEQRTHTGLRSHGEWLPNSNSWLEISYMSGKTGLTSTAGWGFDIGNTWMAENGFNFTVAYALGQGDKPQSETNNTFRQTGLQDNNARFAGVTSFRYYGELLDPELANLEIFTAGAGFRFKRKISVDLVGHYYEQNQLSRRLIDSDIDKRPNGRDRELGWEVDFILGWRTNRNWDFEVIGAWFKPGAAFDDADSALLGQLQFRYRF